MTVVLPFDGSASAERAVAYIVNTLAKAVPDNLTVHLLNVQDSGAGMSGLSGRDAAELAEQLTKTALEQGKQLLAAPISMLQKANVAVRPTVRIGDPATEIAGYADDFGADSVVMGTRGLGRVRGLVLGSVASKVVHLVKVPITLVK